PDVQPARRRERAEEARRRWQARARRAAARAGGGAGGEGAGGGELAACPGSEPGRLAPITHREAASSVIPICLHIGTPCVLASRHVPGAIHRGHFLDRPLVSVVPGLLPRDPTRETYRVRPGATTIVALEPGDRLTVRDVHGGQRALLASKELGLEADLFGPESPRGAEETFDAARAAAVAVTAPVGAPVVEGGVPASDLQLEVRRAAPREDLEATLPEPLAEPRLDFEVARASALAYEVAAGEYLQVIDVRGRQCSDLLAFHSGKLERGEERGLDSTTTRSLMGNAYPNPGLY